MSEAKNAQITELVFDGLADSDSDGIKNIAEVPMFDMRKVSYLGGVTYL